MTSTRDSEGFSPPGAKKRGLLLTLNDNPAMCVMWAGILAVSIYRVEWAIACFAAWALGFRMAAWMYEAK